MSYQKREGERENKGGIIRSSTAYTSRCVDSKVAVEQLAIPRVRGVNGAGNRDMGERM